MLSGTCTGSGSVCIGGSPFLGFPFSSMSYAPRSFQRQGMRLVETATRTAQTATETTARSIETITGGNGSFPIENYEELTVDEIAGELSNLSTEELEKVRGYEKPTRNSIRSWRNSTGS